MFCAFLDYVRVDECSNEDLGPLPGPRFVVESCPIIIMNNEYSS